MPIHLHTKLAGIETEWDEDIQCGHLLRATNYKPLKRAGYSAKWPNVTFIAKYVVFENTILQAKCNCTPFRLKKVGKFVLTFDHGR